MIEIMLNNVNKTSILNMNNILYNFNEVQLILQTKLLLNHALNKHYVT